MNDFMFTLWDVEHGLSIWIQTPSGQNHCIDVGKNNDTDFSPYVHMRILHNVKMLDYLIRGCPACFLILKGVVISSHETNRFS